jgi:hypothetical protein
MTRVALISLEPAHATLPGAHVMAPLMAQECFGHLAPCGVACTNEEKEWRAAMSKSQRRSKPQPQILPLPSPTSAWKQPRRSSCRRFGTPETDEAALRLGMRLLFTLNPGMVRPGDPAFFVKRVIVNSRNWRRVTRWAPAGLPNGARGQ